MRRLQKWRVFVGVWREWAPSAGAARPFVSCSHSSDSSFSSFSLFLLLWFIFVVITVSFKVSCIICTVRIACVLVRPLRAFWGAFGVLVVIWKWDPWYIDLTSKSAADPESPTRSSVCLYASLCVIEIQYSCRSQCKLIQPAIVLPLPLFTFLFSFISLHLDLL